MAEARLRSCLLTGWLDDLSSGEPGQPLPGQVLHHASSISAHIRVLSGSAPTVGAWRLLAGWRLGGPVSRPSDGPSDAAVDHHGPGRLRAPPAGRRSRPDRRRRGPRSPLRMAPRSTSQLPPRRGRARRRVRLVPSAGAVGRRPPPAEDRVPPAEYRVPRVGLSPQRWRERECRHPAPGSPGLPAMRLPPEPPP